MVSTKPQVPGQNVHSTAIYNDLWRGYLYKYPTSTRPKSPGCGFYQQLLARVLVALQILIKDYYILNSFKDLDCNKYPGQYLLVKTTPWAFRAGTCRVLAQVPAPGIVANYNTLDVYSGYLWFLERHGHTTLRWISPHGPHVYDTSKVG